MRGLIFAIFSPICEKSTREKFGIMPTAKKWEEDDDPRIFFLTFTYKYNEIQLNQYLLLHDIVYPTCCWHRLFARRFFFPLLCKTMTLLWFGFCSFFGFLVFDAFLFLFVGCAAVDDFLRKDPRITSCLGSI